MKISNMRPVYQKPTGHNRKSNQPTVKQRERWEQIRARGCSVCKAPEPEIHHALTGAGGRKHHDKVFPLCFLHHRGELGIHTIGRKAWQEQFGSEQSHLDALNQWKSLTDENGRV